MKNLSTIFYRFAVIIYISLLIASCSKSKPQFTVQGVVSGNNSEMLYLEKRGLNETSIIDSVKLDKDGKFSFKEQALGYPEFYLLRLGNEAINIAVDSTETITINTAKKEFGSNYTIEGSESAIRIKDIVKLQQALTDSITSLKKQYDAKTLSANEYLEKTQQHINIYKEKAKEIIYTDYNSLAAYFALFQRVGDYLIFDPYDKKDLRAFQAVATVWDQYKSASPRTEHLKNFTLAALAEVRKQENEEATLKQLESVQLSESNTYYDIALPDKHGKEVKLSSLTGKVVILDFTTYLSDFSPAHNIALNKIYTKYKPNVEIYQVSFDDDQHAWQNATASLPWICVRDNKSLASPLIPRFNIQALPTIYVLNKKGEIIKKADSLDQLYTEIQKIL